MTQMSTQLLVALMAALIAMGSLLAFAWFMATSAISRIVGLEVRVETLEKMARSNREDDSRRPPKQLSDLVTY